MRELPIGKRRAYLRTVRSGVKATYMGRSMHVIPDGDGWRVQIGLTRDGEGSVQYVRVRDGSVLEIRMDEAAWMILGFLMRETGTLYKINEHEFAAERDDPQDRTG